MKELIGRNLLVGHANVSDFVLHVKLVAGIVLSVCFLTTTIIFIMVLVILHEPGVSYSENFINYSITQSQLLPALIVSGLPLVLFTAGLTWLIAIYTSFRIAGPLHRISVNLKNALDTGNLSEFSFRKGDSMEAKTREIRQNFDSFKEHEKNIENYRIQVSQALSRENPDIKTASKALEVLQEEVKRVRL